ncbi:hypothetical protein EDB89DRAFT_2125258 [Lactarius sanguifluus]|nr:hypothetical protein EDB89DRAFT_2125258 [Lactarius sanguifluus]
MSPQLEHPTIVTVSSVALVASVDVVDVVKTGQLGTTTLRTDSTLSAEPLNFSCLHLVLKILLSLSSILLPSSNALGCPYPQGSGQLHSWLGRCVVGLKLSTLAPEPATSSFIGLTCLRPIDFVHLPSSLADQYRIPAKCTSSTPPALPLQSHILSFFRTFNIGIPRTNRSKGNPETIAYAEPLFNIMPALAECFYRVLHNLSIYCHTPDFMMRYLHLRESFFTRQLAALPFIIPHVEVQYSNGSRVAVGVAASSPSLPSFGCGPTSSTLSHWTFTHSLFATISRASQSYSDLWKRTSRDIPHIEVQYSDGSRVTTSVAASSPSLPSFGCGPTSSTLSHWTFTRGHLKGRLKSYYLD